MKTASVQHLDALVNNKIHASYPIEFKPLTDINTYIMKKLTNVSPFLLLLVPVFMMMVLTISSNAITSHQNEAAIKATASTSVAKIPASIK